jgi:hypothetical protein
MKTFLPIDFNSLSKVQDGKINLSDYYIDYAFSSSEMTPGDGIEITLFDKGWVGNSSDIICLDATLRKNSANTESWFAELKDKVYTSSEKPNRRYFTAFIGADTRRLVEDGSQTGNYWWQS